MASIDFTTLTLGEVAAIEELSGQSISALADDDAPKGTALAAIAMVVKRRTGDPGYTFNQALTLSLAEANAIVEGGNGDDEGKDDSSGTSETE